MLAKDGWFEPAPVAPLPDVNYSGFPFWEAFLAEPNREQRSADWLKNHLNVVVYWPHYFVKTRCGPRSHRHRPRGVISCTILAPVELLDVKGRDRILDWAGLRPRNFGRDLTKFEVDLIREIEGKLNVTYDKKTHNFQIGQRVRFLNDLYAAFFGEGVVIDLASSSRIRVKVNGKLFGGKDEITVPAAELEPL